MSNTECIEEVYFNKSPINVDVVSGKSVTLPCEVTPDAGITYYWELNGNYAHLSPHIIQFTQRFVCAGSKIDNTTRRHQQGSNLHITRVDRERDSGQFTCIAQDLTGLSITSSAASLNIQCKSFYTDLARLIYQCATIHR